MVDETALEMSTDNRGRFLDYKYKDLRVKSIVTDDCHGLFVNSVAVVCMRLREYACDSRGGLGNKINFCNFMGKIILRQKNLKTIIKPEI